MLHRKEDVRYHLREYKHPRDSVPWFWQWSIWTLRTR